jgi:hypothetical protein
MSRFWGQVWSRSWAYQVALVLSMAYALLRLGVQGVYIAGRLPGQPEEYPIPIDLQVYLDAAAHVRAHQDIYLQADLSSIEYQLPYPPAYALAFVPFLWIPSRLVAVVQSLLHVGAFVLLYVWWRGMFHDMGMCREEEVMIWTLPVWLFFGAFWSDLGYLNIYIILALLATLLLDAVLHERTGLALLWLSMILQTKPMWAFAVGVPLLLGRYRFLVKLLVLAGVVYLAIAGVTIWIVGPAYGWEQYGDYVRLLPRLTRAFPWRGPDAPFLGYNHSIKQVLIYILGPSPALMRLATWVKVAILLPLAVVAVRFLMRPARQAGYAVPYLGLDLGFALYLGAFIWLDIVWELSLGIVVFAYLLATLQRRGAIVLTWAVFLPYALVDFWQIAGYAIWGMDVILPGPYVLTDPSIYVPLIMIVILWFYALLVHRLWGAPVPVRSLERAL